MRLKNPWYDRRNETSPQYFEVGEPIASEDVIDFYDYQGTVLGVVNGRRAYGKIGVGDTVVTQCVTLAGAKRHIFG